MIINSRLKSIALLIYLMWLLSASQPIFAWGVDGHRLTAEAAERLLNPKASAEVRRLLSLEQGATMGSVAAWADEARTLADARWHYVNFLPGSGCKYDGTRDCLNGGCVVEAIRRQSSLLGSSAPDTERLRALKYVIHLVADVHQPLHAGYAHDRGGNLFQLQAYGRGTNLHALWDSGLIVNWPRGTSVVETALREAAIRADVGDPASWAEESCRLVEEAWFYPSARTLDEDYAERSRPVMIERLKLAAARLADLLNQRLGAR